MAGENNYQDIKAGVDGVLGDVPEPSEMTSEGSISETIETTGEGMNTTTEEQTYEQPTNNYESSESYVPQPALDSERIQSLVEAVVKEKFEEMTAGVGNLAAWKEKVNNDLIGIKQELLRSQQRFEALQNAIAGKLGDYDQGIRNVTTEMKALEKVFEKILEPLTSNIKELGRITEDMKKNKK